MTVSFSLTFSILPAVVVTKCTESTNNYNSFANRVYSISLSSFKIAPDSHKGFSWIAIGIQQWGKDYYASDVTRTINYPLTFTTIYGVVGWKIATIGDKPGSIYVGMQSISNANFTTRSHAGIHTTYWVAMGI